MRPVRPSHITASIVAPPVDREKWFSVKASATSAELRLRGYIGEPSKYIDWDGESIDTGGMGTLKEFEDALLALGSVPLITVYLTSEGGDFPTAIAISSILARQTARIVCVIDGYAYSAAPVIACAADEVRCAKNALIMIHDAEFWCDGRDVASLQEAIKTLEACNTSMAAAFVNKAGGTPEEWMARMVATTWMTGEEAAALKLVDVITDEVALSAYQPLKQVTAKYRPPQNITALIDTPPVTSPAPAPDDHSMKATPQLIATAAAFGITLTAESDEAAVTAALSKITAAAPVAIPPVVTPPASGISAADVKSEITAAMKPLEEKIKHLEGVRAQGLGPGEGSPTAAAPRAVPAAGSAGAVDTSKMTAMQLIHHGRTQLPATK